MRKPKPQQKLEQLVAAQEEAAEMEALAEHEVAHSYRAHADISHRLGVPRDVVGLVGLVEERKLLEQELLEIRENYYGRGYFGPSIFTGFFLGAAPGFILSLYCAKPASTLAEFAGYFGGLLLGIGGGLLGVRAGHKLSERITGASLGCKQFEQEQSQKIQEVQEKVQSLDQKLSRYETNYKVGDFVLFEDNEYGSSIGQITAKEEDQFVLSQGFHNNLYVNPNQILYVLEEVKDASVDDLRAMAKGGTNIPAVFYERTESVAGGYGFLKEDTNRKYLGVFADTDRKKNIQTLAYWWISNGTFTAKLLAPVLK